ncbi:MAG: cytochrome D1 domain-containing protein [Nitrospinota bacterium]
MNFNSRFQANRFLPLLLMGFLFVLFLVQGASAGGPLAYVANEEGTISVIDLAALKVVKTLRVGKLASHGLVLSPDGKRLYTGNLDLGSLIVLNADTLKKEAEVEIGARVHGIDLSPDGRWLFAVGGADPLHVTVVDTASLKVDKQIPYRGVGPSHMDFTPNGRRAYVANLRSDDITMIDVARRKVVATIPVGIGPNELRISPDGRYAYVANVLSSELTVVDLAFNKVVAHLPAGKGAHGVAITPDGKEAFVANRAGGDVWVFDTKSNKVVSKIPTGKGANHVAITRYGKRVLVSNEAANTVSVIDTATQQVVKTIPVGKSPHVIAIGDFSTVPARVGKVLQEGRR